MGNNQLPAKTSDECVKLAKEQGFTPVRQTGSHLIAKNGSGKIVVIPMHRGELPRGTLRSILKMIGLLALALPLVLIPQIVQFVNSEAGFTLWNQIFPQVIR